MGIMNEYINESPYIKGREFEDGLTLEVVGVEKAVGGDEFGATAKDWLFKKEILSEGETFRYTFLQDGQEKIYETKSAVFFIAFRNLDPDKGKKIIIKREGQGRDTKYDIKYAPIDYAK